MHEKHHHNWVRAHNGAGSSLMTTTLVNALLAVHQQTRLAGVLTAVAAAGPRLGAPWYVACLLRDSGTGGWYVTAMVDGAGRTASLERLEAPTGPFAFAPAPAAADVPRPLAALLGEAWGPDFCAAFERRLGTVGALCAPIRGPRGVRGALIGLLTAAEPATALAGVLLHGAAAAARHLDQEQAPVSDGVLDPQALADQAGKEIARATRYHREMAVALFETDSLATLAHFGPVLVRSLRRWDLIGRWPSDRPQLVACLPETGRGGARGLVRRLGGSLAGIASGAATFPDDGANLVRLVEIASGRMALDGFSRSPSALHSRIGLATRADEGVVSAER